MAEPIEIIIRKTQETSTQDTVQGAGAEDKQVSGKESTGEKAINTALVNAGKQLASYAVSQYGSLTGNTMAQNAINTVLNVAGYAGEIIVGGWVGAIAVGVQVMTSLFSSEIDTQKRNQQERMLYELSGNVTLDGGRGTYE